ncbi:ankyrin repeat domain-containing protein [Wolbachia endosymbiont (group A) of Oxytorus armatus]|uniref:ankyrin repeat domain-containing protein n=1 Tax=Wolbachia endosymbiont (group A) of Oxytorus armatus TaxID=3066211 RepID=UPI003132C769
MPNQEKPQGFELIELLIREAGSNAGASPSTSTQQGSDFESFKARFQSYIDQIPSYLHSVGKAGFFPHFFLGSFSTLIDTEIAKKLDIEKIYFSFDGSKTLKVAVIRKGGITNQKSAIEKVNLFVISEFGKNDSKSKKFTYGELEEILGQSNLPAQNEHVRSAKDDLKVKLVKIVKATGEISVEVKDDKLDKNTSATHEFKEIKKGLWNNPESDIAKLTNPDVEKVKKPVENILKKVSKIHSEYKNSLTCAQETREAAHHGFIAGALVNFRYRHNLRVYLEQFAGRGYADIVLVPRGKDRSLNAVPIIIEMKAATKAELKEGKIGEKSRTTPTAALKQAEDYTKGFQPNVMRVLTTANDILCVGVNLDHPSPISDILDKSRNQKIIPLFNQILISIDGRNNGEITQEQLETRIQENIERIYHTFPGTGEKGDNHYFSRFLLGQSLLLNEVKALESDFEKHVFIYGENIPTETRSEGSGRGVPQRQAAKEAGKKLAESNKLDESHAVVTMVFVPENDERLVYVMNIVESDGRAEILKKGIPLNKLEQKIGNRKVVELNLNFNIKEQKSDFKKYFSVEVNEPISLGEYNGKKSDKFKGDFKNVPYPKDFKKTFDEVLVSQLASLQDQSSSIGKYKKLFGKVGEAILPFKDLIKKEAHTQAVFHGAFSHYSDINLGGSQENRALVLTEFQTGRGKRIDMLVHGIKFAGDDSNAKEYTPVGLELKGPREGKTADALKDEANRQIADEYTKGVTYKTLTDGNEVDFMGVVFDKGANSANSLILGSKDEFTPVIVVHSSVHVIPTDQVAQSIDISKGEHLRGGQEVIQKLKNLGIQEENLRTLESAAAEQDYHYWLQQHDIADIARIKYGYGIDGADTLFEVVGSPKHIANQLQQFQNSVATRGEKRPLTLIVNLDNNHWVTLVISHQNGQYNGYYVDSLGNNVPDNIRQVLQQARITVNDVSIAQQRDGYNCGLWALENAKDINTVLQEDRLRNIPDEIRNRLQIQGRNEDHFIHMREGISNELSIDPQRIANLEAVLAETQAPRKKFDLNNCVKQGSRKRRSINPCLFSLDDVKKFIKGRIDENNIDKVIVDSEKFLTYVKSSQNKGKNAQLIEFVGDKNIEGNHKYLFDKVVEDKGYGRYIENERIKNLHGDISQQTGSTTKSSKLKSRLMNAAGGIQLIRGIHGAIVSCKDGTAIDCGLNLGGIAWSFASQPIENVMVQITPKIVASAEKVVGKIIPSTLGKQTKFAVRVMGVKFGSTIARGTAGAITGVFDIVDIGMSASNLVDCKKRENSDNPCGEKEIRDNIATISFSTISFVSGVALTALSMPGIGIAAGVALMVASGVYSGVSNIVEYEKKYDTTHDENWRIFWHTFAFQPIPQDVQHLAARKEMVNSLTKGAWQTLNNSLNSTVAYGIGFGKVSGNTLRPDYAKILMNKEERANTRSLSRVIPHRIEDASRICLPQVTDQDYEKEGTTNSLDFASYYCENSMVISHDNRVKGKQKDKTIVYDLSNVNKGAIVGNNEWSNNFLIDSGTAEITGGNKVVNRFIVNSIDFSGKIIGGGNSVNILDLSQLKDKVIGVNVNYRFKPSASGSLKARVNGRWLINDQIDNNGIFSYYYVGRKNKVDEISCMGYSEHFTGIDDRDVIIDSSGGSNKNEKDVVENCKKVIISPYTTVKGGKSNYTFYVKAADYKGNGLYSEIDVDGTGTVIFPEIDLLGDCDQITYSTNSNTLSLKINFGQNNQFTLDVKNYVEQSSNKPHFALIDKNGSNIVPKIERSDLSTIKITSFELHSEHSLDNFDDVASHYKKIPNNNKDYKVFSVIRDRVQNQGNSAVPHMVFGSLEDDVINFDQGTIFARGGGGSDVYFISNDINSGEVKIDNNSSDKKLDTLFMSAVEKDFSIQQCDLYLKYNNSNIRVKNYFQDPNYRHLIIMNKKGETFIPNIQSMSCSPSSSGKGKLVPFLQATQTQNMFLLSKDFQGDHVVIDSRLKDIKKYKDKDDLLLIRESEIPFMIRIEGFYTEQSKWENISYSLWNNDHFSPSPELLENVDNVMEHKDKLRSDYERVVKEYIEDFSNSTSITQHNQKLEKNISTSVGQDEERIGVMILKNITPGQVEIFSNGADLIFRDKMSNHTINIKDWDNNEFHRISTLEFDLGLEPITLRRLDRFSLSEVRKIQALIDKASENYQNRSKYTPKVENDFKCLMSVDDFERENKEPTHQCLGFSSLQERVGFTENSCSLEQIKELKSKIPSSSQILSLLEKLENNLLLNGYDRNIIDRCNKWMTTSGLGVLKPLVSRADGEGKSDEVKTLLDRTANRSNVNVEHKNQCSQNWTALNYAVYNGNVELSQSILKPFLKKKGDINALTSCNDDNWALLHYAVHYDNLDMVSFLIDKGAKVDIQSKKGKTPLYLAIEEAKQLDIVKLLLDRGADIKIKYNGRTPLYLAAYNGNLDIITFFCDRIKAESNNLFKIEQIKFLKEEVVNQANIPSDTKRLVESCISSLRGSIKSEAKRVLKDGMLNGRSASTIELLDEVYNFDEKLFDRAIKEAVNDTYSSVGIEGILKFIASHNYIGQFISGYIAVFDKIPEDDGAMFKLAYSIRETMKMPRVNSEEKSDLEKLKNKLPESVSNAVFSSEVCIKNVEYGRYLYSPNNDCMYHLNNCDRDRRYVFTWPSNGNSDQFKWKVELNGDNVYLKNVEYGRYLYSPNDDCTYHLNDCDRGRRYAFTWPSNSNSDQFKWKVEPNGDNVYLKNVEYGRYLYSPNSASTFQVDNNRRYVFTWPSNEEGGQFKWKIENCGSTRKRRSIQELNGYNQTVVDYQSILTEENSQQIASRISAIVEDIERHTFVNQSKNKLDLDSYLNNRGRSNAADSMKRDVCSELNASRKRNIVLSGNDVCSITSGYETLDVENFHIQEVVINDDADGKKSLRSTLDLHHLVQQINRDLSIKPIPTVIKGKSDLLIKLSISATGLQQDVITVRLKDALVNKWYKKLQIIFDNAPMEIDDSLGLKSSFFISDEKIIVVTPQDIEEKNKLVISKKAGQYTYLHDKYDLIVTNAFNANIEASELCIIYFRDFYKEPKMETLSIRFIDKEILLSNEIDKIHNSDSIDKLNNVSSIVNSQESFIHSEVSNSGDINAQGKLDRTLLHLASEAGEFDKVKLLLDRGANIEVQDKFGYTPIFLATQSGKWSIVKLLLDRGANIDAQDEKGQTLLHFAASGNNLDMVQFLLDRGANIEIQDKLAWTPILYAAQSGKWNVVKLLISNGAKFNNEITIQGTPLHFAVQEGNLDIIRFLLDEGADTESQDKDNKKPLHLAVEADRLNIVELLLDRGASVNAKDENNKTPLDLATKEDVKELLKRAQLDQGLLISAQDGNLDKVVEYFIGKRVSLKVKDRDGKTPLDLAEQKGHTDIAKVIKQMQLELDKKLLSAVKNGDLNKVEDFISQGTSLEVKDSNGNTLLHYASQNDHLEVVEYLIKKGASLKAKNKDGKTPLDLALQKNYISIIEFLKKTQLDLDEELLATVKGDDLNRVKALVSQGASLEAKDNSNNTPLHNACNNGHVKVVEYLIQEGDRLKAKNKDGEAPLHVAVQHDGTLEVIEFILSRDLSGINDITNNGKTPLHLAIREDKPNTVQLLLRKGANIAVKDKNGKTSLDLAKQEDYTNIVEMIEEVQSDLDEGLLTAVQDGNLNEAEGLVSRNANVNTRDKYSWTPLHWAAYKGHLEVAEFLVKKGADVNAASENLYGSRPIHIAIENNNKNIIEFLLSKEVGVNDTDKQGYTPLHYAAWRGRLEVARFLIEKGADINAADTSTAGKKPIHVAAENNSESVIEFLLEKGVSVDEADKNGWTPLHYAARFGQPEVAKFLIEKGADINVADASIAGKRPIHVATEENNKDIIEFFLSKGVSVNDTDKDSRTPLHWASWSGHLDLVKYFIDKGANINAECNDSKTPLDVAIDLKYNNVVEYLQRTQLDLNEQLLAAVQGGDFKKVKDLVSRGASLDAKDKEGKIPLHFAAQEGNLDMVQFFLNRGANTKAEDMYGWTPLHFASAYGKFDVVKFFLDSNINIRAKDRYGDTPLHLAAQNNDKSEIVESFLDSDANNINDRTNNGWTPLHVALQGNKPSTVKLLLGVGADIEVQDIFGETPLVIATRAGYTDIVKILEQEQLGKELFTAVREYDFSRVEKLISRGANIDTKNKNGKTPLDIAINTKNALEENQGSLNNALSLGQQGRIVRILEHEQLNRKLFTAVREENLPKVRELISRGANIDTERDGKTPLDVAKEKLREHSKNEECSDVVQCLEKLNQKRGEAVQRKRRHLLNELLGSSNQPEIAASGSTRPSSWINDLFSWVKSSVGGFRAVLPEETSSTTSSILQVDAPIDVNGTIMLLDVLVRKVTGQKYIFTSDQNVSLLEAQGYALNITEKFEKVVEQAALKSGISMHRLNIDYMGMQKEITKKVMSGKFNEISGISKSYIEKACPGEESGKLSPKKFEKFIAQFNKGLLNQSIEQILHNRGGRLEVDGTKKQQISLEPQSYLSNASVHSHSEVSTCLSEIGVTKLGGNINR